MIHYPVTLVGTIVDKFANSQQYNFFYQHKEKHIVLYDGYWNCTWGRGEFWGPKFWKLVVYQSTREGRKVEFPLVLA